MTTNAPIYLNLDNLPEDAEVERLIAQMDQNTLLQHVIRIRNMTIAKGTDSSERLLRTSIAMCQKVRALRVNSRAAAPKKTKAPESSLADLFAQL